MRRFFFLVAALVVAEPVTEHEILLYEVDVEVAPSERYARVLADLLQRRGPEAFIETYEGWNFWLSKAMPELFGNRSLAEATQSKWLATLNISHPKVVAELVTIASSLRAVDGTDNPILELPALATVVSLYPILNTAAKNSTDTKPSACTSILARQADGKVLHGRSLDYEPRDPMAKATVAIDFHRQGRRLYRCLHPMQYPSALQWFTCVRPGAFSLSVNARSQGVETEHNASFDELLRRMSAPGVELLGELAERAMTAESYEDALAELISRPVVSSNYFILAGAQGQGAVVTRFGNESSADVWALGSSSHVSDGQPPWLRVQTNVDHWVSFASGAYATHRRQHALDLFEGIGQHSLDKDSFLDVYFTTTARAGSEQRRAPEDTGVILRPTTIASLVMDPNTSLGDKPDLKYWHVWAETPSIQPAVTSAATVQV